MISTRLAFALAAGLAGCGSAAAHSELHSANWCSTGTVAYTGEIFYTADELHAEYNRRQQDALRRCLQETGNPNTTSGGVGTCGVFDPPYEMAVSMARAACGDPGSTTPTPDSPVVVFIDEPQAFNDPDHHQLFNLDSGLHGMCGICVNSGPIPVPRDQN
ncbi:MAG: hypothetical protein BGP24_14405 [Lysobacterales bacterium 69-70]|nr:hypothetical protein [Xanthomonadaceae bacterium]ODU35282.1 MAG: hypothetical protein ABS97_05240 [Xanthomonadaceae bacterium SCN 69-320]ODV17253.1 MAG: hypothetical protein ABT27_18000 [Xanthomonadaceae bacterium SCN 69-25]OJY94179.1 MAG: hypothetical protein BGP24_14405 [Xanthomonadales bacterium 69-70]